MIESTRDRFSQFFAETQDALLRYVRRLIRSPEAAEDIVQEAYARTLGQAGQVAKPKAFLYVTARNLAWKAHRQQQVAATEPVERADGPDSMHDGAASPEDALPSLMGGSTYGGQRRMGLEQGRSQTIQPT